MWRTVVLGGVNVVLGVVGALTGVPGLDLTPVAMVMIAQGGEGIVLGAVILTVMYMLPKPGRFAWVWLQVPTAILAGYLAIWQQNLYVPIIAYHAISVGAAIILRAFDGRYLIATLVSIGLNLAIVRALL